MIVKVFKDPKLRQDSITINYRKMNSKINKIIDIAEHKQPVISVKSENTQKTIDVSDLYYIETVDKKYFVYTFNNVYETSYSLKELETLLSDYGFVRINRSMIINIYHVSEIKADYNMRLFAILDNKEIVTITRHYRKDFFQKTKSTQEGLKTKTEEQNENK